MADVETAKAVEPEKDVLPEDEEEDEDFGDTDSEEEEEFEEAMAAAKKSKAGKTKTKKRKAKRKGSQFFEEEAEEDSEEEDEGAGGEGPSKKRSKFIDDMAAIGDDEEDIDEFDADDPFLQDEQAEAEAVKNTNASKYRQLDTRDKFQTDEDLEKFVQERYMRQPQEYQEVEEDAAAGAGDYMGKIGQSDQNALQPTTQDPYLWLLKVKAGKEKDLVMRIMQKAIHYENRKRRTGSGPVLQIASAVHHSNLKGYIYIEARKASAVKKAVEGMQDVYQSYDIKSISQKEMTDALRLADTSQVDTKVGDWVKFRGGIYKRDLARVATVENDGKIKVKVVPRIDYVAIREKEIQRSKPKDVGSEGDQGNLPKAKKVRVHAKAFNVEEAKRIGIALSYKTSRDRDLGEVIECSGKEYHNGYELKKVSLKSVYHVKPSYDELQRYNQAEVLSNGNARDLQEDEDADRAYQKTMRDANELEQATQKDLTPQAAAKKFAKGDDVIVARGELQNLVGTVTMINAQEGLIHVQPAHQELTDVLPIDAMLLEKYFTVGKHVKVTNGVHADITGMVVEVTGSIAVLFTDNAKEQVKVFMRDLMDCTEVTTGLTKFGEYNLTDLVQLMDTESGVIVAVEKESCRVMIASDVQKVRTCRLTDISRKIYASNLTGFDIHNNNVNVGDIVKIVKGDHQGKSGTVKHVAKNNFLFIECREVLENLGIICVRSKCCEIKGGEVPMGGAASGRPGFAAGVPKSYRALQRESPLIGKKIKINKGPYKGYMGKVKDANDRTVRIELEAQCKVVTVKHAHLTRQHQRILHNTYDSQQFMVQAQQGQGMYPTTAAPTVGIPSFGQQAAGAQTPMHNTQYQGPGAYGMQTPMHTPFGAQTPMHGASELLSPFRVDDRSGLGKSNERSAHKFDANLLMNAVCQAREQTKYGKIIAILADNFVTLQLGSFTLSEGFQPGTTTENFSLKELDLVKPRKDDFVRILAGEDQQDGIQYSKLFEEDIGDGDDDAVMVRGVGEGEYMADLKVVTIQNLAYIYP